MPDLGEELVEAIFRKLQVDEEWATRAERGFSWIAHRLEQSVWASKPIEDDGYTLFRLCAETVVVDSVSAPEATIDRLLSNLNRHSFGSCYIYDPATRRIFATTSTWVHQEVAGLRFELLHPCIIGQLCFAEAEADFLADKACGTVASRDHGISGRRRNPDDMLNVVGELVVSTGQEASRYQNAFEFDAVADVAKRSESVATLGGSAGGISLECSFASGTAIAILRSTERHRLLGSGLYVTLHLPIPITPEDGYRISAMLNRRERSTDMPGGPGHLGAWCVHPQPVEGIAVTYRRFLPNFMYAGGLIMDTAIGCIGQMRRVDRIMNFSPTKESPWQHLRRRLGLLSRED
ncbi:MAG: hypothetical protein IT368_05905 [Candidatus Hydrogenedentes bacterium]|nr:hypothetical protein [Candidatus Hydrogenedentota bacterium]